MLFSLLTFDLFINIIFFGIIVHVVGKLVHKPSCLVYDVIFKKFEFFSSDTKDCSTIENLPS